MTEPIRVVMLDLSAMVPYYNGHLCASLRGAEDLRISLASISYQYDPEYFRREGISNDAGLLDLSYRLVRVPAALRRPLKVIEYVVNMAALLAKCVVRRPDIVHVQFLPLATVGIGLEKWWLRSIRALGIKVVYTVHNLLPQDTGCRHEKGYASIYRLSDRLICHDADAATHLAKRFDVAPERISIIPHGPLFEERRTTESGNARAGLGVAPDECLVMWQGILRPYKGVSFLLRAWRQVCAHNARARLVVAGTGEEELTAALEREVAELGIGQHVRLELRFVSVRELADFYEAADILVYPYSQITTSGALMTGIVRRKAIIATALPAFNEILRDGVNALLVRYGDEDELAAALLRLVGDAGLRRELGERLREAPLPQWGDIARRTRECYRLALSHAEPAVKPIRVNG